MRKSIVGLMAALLLITAGFLIFASNDIFEYFLPGEVPVKDVEYEPQVQVPENQEKSEVLTGDLTEDLTEDLHSDNGAHADPVSNRNYWPTENWAESSPDEQGMDPSILYKVRDNINRDETCLHSLLVVRNGYLVFEEYYNGYDKYKKNAVQSVTKSIISALTGIAISEGYLESVDQKVIDIFPEYFEDNTDELKEKISIRHLLTMSAGLRWQQDGEIRNQWLYSKDRHKYLIGLPMESEPGEVFNYSSGFAHLMSGIIAKAAGMSTEKLAEIYLFRHLGISDIQWGTDQNGYTLGNAGLFMTPRDMAKIGYLFLNDGSWEDKEIIPSEWVRESTEKQIDIGSDFAGYGYYWWINKINNHECFFARGYGGQYIIVIPDVDIVVVITSRWDKEELGPEYFMDIVGTYVIGSVTLDK